uniref:Uncharacterized protein n=1 Tax=Anguilla anguilla TaxID=7936 RepID=A0A0E9RH61_ANGAN
MSCLPFQIFSIFVLHQATKTSFMCTFRGCGTPHPFSAATGNLTWVKYVFVLGFKYFYTLY